MTAPTPPEVREAAVVEEVARAIHQEQNRGASWKLAAGYICTEYRRLAVAAVAAYRATQDGGSCGDLSPGINFGGDGDVERLMCELPVGHGGAHQHDNRDGLPPTRWIATQDGGAEETLRDALRVHHPIMRSETGPFSGCRCGQVKLGQDVIGHVTGHLRAARPGWNMPSRPREDRGVDHMPRTLWEAS